MFHLYNIHVDFPPDIFIFVILFLSVGAILLFSVSLLLPVFLFFSSCWSKYPVFYLFPPIQLASSFFPLEQIFCFSAFSPIQLASFFFALGDFPLFWLFAPIQSQSCLNPASTKLQINPRLRSDHPRSGLTSASSVYRWIHTLQVQIVQIQLPHR